MFPANTNSVKLKKSSFLWKVQTLGEDFCVDLPHREENVGARYKRLTSFL
jgi:hypothetical protein